MFASLLSAPEQIWPSRIPQFIKSNVFIKKFQLAVGFVEQLRQQLQINLAEDKAAAIALHLVNDGQVLKMGDSFLYEQVQKKCPDANKCVNKILIYLKEKYQISLDSEEVTYLILHVARLVEERN